MRICIFMHAGEPRISLHSCLQPLPFLPAAEGGALPTYASVVAAAAQYPPGYVVPATTGGGSGGATPPPPGGATLTITGFPAVGAFSSITGTVSGLGTATGGYVAVLYIRDGGGVNFWSKPQPGVTFPVTATGAFSLAGWSSSTCECGRAVARQ